MSQSWVFLRCLNLLWRSRSSPWCWRTRDKSKLVILVILITSLIFNTNHLLCIKKELLLLCKSDKRKGPKMSHCGDCYQCKHGNIRVCVAPRHFKVSSYNSSTKLNMFLLLGSIPRDCMQSYFEFRILHICIALAEEWVWQSWTPSTVFKAVEYLHLLEANSESIWSS